MDIVPISGIRLAASAAGIKNNNKPDLVAIEIAAGASVAAVFTQNAFCAAPVTVAKENLQSSVPRCLIINSGNANAGTGNQGILDAQQCCHFIALGLNCKDDEVLPFSTGVIGENLPIDKFANAIPSLLKNLHEDAWESAAMGILTTDTRPKLMTRQLQIQGQTISITGIAKGAGMIRPNMATLLAYIATDARIEQSVLNECLKHAVDESFNKITIDGDTSTNDSCVLVATHRVEMKEISDPGSEDFLRFRDCVTQLCEALAKELVRDAEGGTKLVSIEVTGGLNREECEQTAYTVAHSPLTKTALFACDPNWGRILAAVGRSGIENLDVNKVTIQLDNVLIAEKGARSPDYREVDAQRVMDKAEYSIRIGLGRGEHSAHVWTCDLSYDYVKINAEYRS